MEYELRIDGRTTGFYMTADAAEKAAREWLLRAPDVEPEVFDTSTGRAHHPAGSQRWRDELAAKIG